MNNTYNYGSHKAQIGYHTVIQYNGIVSPEDGVF